MKKYIFILALCALLLVLINQFDFKGGKITKRPKKAVKKMEIDKKQFDKDLANFLFAQEGGLSNDPTDKASARPSPTPQKWHTNKGVTYRVFVDSAKSIGYNPTTDLFVNMPDSIPLALFRQKYYKQAEKLTDSYLLNNYLALWFWGGWNKKLMPVERVAKVIASNTSEAKKLTELVNLRKEYFNNIVKANPSQKRFLKGWLNRADIFLKDFIKYAKN